MGSFNEKKSRELIRDNWRCVVLGFGMCVYIVWQEVDLSFPNNAVRPLSTYFRKTFVNHSGINPLGLSEAGVWSLFASSPSWTGLLACFLGPVICDNLGRKHSFLLFTLVGFFASAIETAAPILGPLALLFGRLVSMLGDNLGVIVIPVILAEVAPPALRGPLAALLPLGFCTGNMLGAFLGLEWLFGNCNWFIPYLMVTIASGLMIPMVVWMRPTPVELVGSLEEERARQALVFYRASDADFASVQKDSQVAAETSFSSVKILQLFTDETLRTQTLLCLAIGIVFSPILELNIYSTLLFEQAGNGPALSATLTTGLTIVAFLTVVVSFFTVDALPRRRLFLPSVAVMACSLLLLIPAQALVDCDILTNESYKLAVQVLTTTLLYVSLLAISLGPRVLFFVLVPELLPFRYRVTGKCISYAAHMLASSLLTLLTPPLFAARLGWTLYTFMLLLIATTGAFLWLYLPETKGKDPHEIFLLFQFKEGSKKKPGPKTPLISSLSNASPVR